MGVKENSVIKEIVSTLENYEDHERKFDHQKKMDFEKPITMVVTVKQ